MLAHAGQSATHSCNVSAYAMLPLSLNQCGRQQFWNHTRTLTRSIASANMLIPVMSACTAVLGLLDRVSYALQIQAWSVC